MNKKEAEIVEAVLTQNGQWAKACPYGNEEYVTVVDDSTISDEIKKKVFKKVGRSLMIMGQSSPGRSGYQNYFFG